MLTKKNIEIKELCLISFLESEIIIANIKIKNSEKYIIMRPINGILNPKLVNTNIMNEELAINLCFANALVFIIKSKNIAFRNVVMIKPSDEADLLVNSPPKYPL